MPNPGRQVVFDMPKLQNSRPEVEVRRNDSLSRMLELEKKYKMQRIQGNGAASPTPPLFPDIRPPPYARSNSMTTARPPRDRPTPPAHRSRHPTMAVVSKSPGLPSLSISIPPSPTSALAVRADGMNKEQSRSVITAELRKESQEPAKSVKFSDPEEDDSELSDESSICHSPSWEDYGKTKKKANKRQAEQKRKENEYREPTKSVKFSDPEEDDAELSDQSSICHSPSWEDYGQNKKKAKKREAEQKRKEKERKEKESNALKKKRLSKSPPSPSIPEAKPLAESGRSLSAPLLEHHQKLTERKLNRSTTEYPPDAMANHHNLMKQQPSGDENGKPKAKGFLSSFRLQHSNVAADTQSLRSVSSVPPHQKSTAPGSGVDIELLNTRKPPSINSVVSTSTHSNSSQERRPGLGRSFSSSHGRRSSFLAKLRGPSYLYHHSHADPDSGESGTARSLASPQKTESTMSRPMTAQDTTRPPPVSAPTQAAGGPAERPLRGRQYNSHTPQLRDSSSDYGESDTPGPRVRQHRELTSDTPVANEGRRRPRNYVEKAREQFQNDTNSAMSRQVNAHSDSPKNQLQETQRISSHLTRPNGRRQFQVELSSQPDSLTSPSSQGDYASPYMEEVDQLSVTYAPHREEDDKTSTGTHTSRSRPVSQGKEQTLTEESQKPSGSPSPPTKGRAGKTLTHDVVQNILVEDARYIGVDTRARDRDVNSARLDVPAHQPERLSDYFTFISESYAPPYLELRSPSEEKFPSSPRINEESGEEEDTEASWDRVAISQEGRIKEQEKSNEAAGLAESTGLTGGSKSLNDSNRRSSPVLFAHPTDRDMSASRDAEVFTRAAQVSGTSTTSTAPPDDQPSRSTSERSSSSTCEDAPASPSTATTPDTSRPQSRKDFPTDIPRSVPNSATPGGDERLARRSQRSKGLEQHSQTKSRSTSREAKLGDESWSRTALPFELDHDMETSTSGRLDAIIPNSSLIGTPTSAAFAEALEEEPEEELDMPLRPSLPPKAQSAIDLTSTSFLPPLKHQPLNPRKNKAGTSSISLPNSPPPELEAEILVSRPSAMKPPKETGSKSHDSAASISAGAAYLQEARKSAPAPPPSSSRALRPIYPHKNSLPRTVLSERKGEPVAKMLVECCNCKFFHDMPSRVYECMAKPDSVVEDRILGVSAAITTTVKCPWCSHGMTTQCCSGYAAMVFLKEKLHGK